MTFNKKYLQIFSRVRNRSKWSKMIKSQLIRSTKLDPCLNIKHTSLHFHKISSTTTTNHSQVFQLSRHSTLIFCILKSSFLCLYVCWWEWEHKRNNSHVLLNCILFSVRSQQRKEEKLFAELFRKNFFDE